MKRSYFILSLVCMSCLWSSAQVTAPSASVDYSQYILTPPAPKSPRINSAKVNDYHARQPVKKAKFHECLPNVVLT